LHNSVGPKVFNTISVSQLGEDFIGVLPQCWRWPTKRSRRAAELRGVTGLPQSSTNRMYRFLEQTHSDGVFVLVHFGG
jgi:hypothetical protein